LGSDKVLESGKKIAQAHILHPEWDLVKETDDFIWRIRSTPRGNPYIVISTDGYICDCPYFKFKGACKHIYCIMVLRGQIK